ncbi:MAG: hypothetical protein NTY83_00975 [Candidatus Micrarchaeota archaeon]|nr:hypothetical protein [Candidatus Micrarchaeota archaeon]
MDTWSMDALMAAGTPMHCTVRYGGDYPGSYEMYILGQKARIEGFSSSGGQTNEMLMISKDNKAYMEGSVMASSPGFENCDWIYFESEETEPTGTSEAVSMDDFEAPPVEYDCAPAVFGEEKFATPGTVCNFQEMMQQQYASYCDDLTGDAKAQCLAAFQ